MQPVFKGLNYTRIHMRFYGQLKKNESLPIGNFTNV